jgi:hypothetical protein
MSRPCVKEVGYSNEQNLFNFITKSSMLAIKKSYITYIASIQILSSNIKA